VSVVNEEISVSSSSFYQLKEQFFRSPPISRRAKDWRILILCGSMGLTVNLREVFTVNLFPEFAGILAHLQLMITY
jgi:hypothetical protein